MPIDRAVILAAGRGKRMGSLTADLPKPMLPVHGRPILEHIIERMKQSGISRFLVVVGFHGRAIREHFPGNAGEIEFVTQDPVNGTGSAALLARGFVSKSAFLLSYGDILCDRAEYARATNILLSEGQIASAIAVKAVDDPWQGAAVYEDEGRVSKIIEKPPKGTSTSRWNSAGFYTFRPVVFDYLARLQPSPRGEYELTSALDAMLQDGLDLRISPIEGDWRDVGRPEDLAAVNQP